MMTFTANGVVANGRFWANFIFDRFFCEIEILGVVDFLVLRFFCEIEILGVVDFWVLTCLIF